MKPVIVAFNGPAAIIFAMYLAVADENGVDRHQLAGTLQNDILKEYQAQKEYVFPPRQSMRRVRDTIDFTAASPSTAKIPPPTIAPTPIETASR